MKIRLPWKKTGHDGRKYSATFSINVEYGTTQTEELFTRMFTFSRRGIVSKLKKRSKSGLKKCPGHKKQSTYTEDGKCLTCGAWYKQGYTKQYN